MPIALLQGPAPTIVRNLAQWWPFPSFAEPLGAMVAWLHTDADPALKPLFDAAWLVYEETKWAAEAARRRAREAQTWDLFGFALDDLTDMQDGFRRDEED